MTAPRDWTPGDVADATRRFAEALADADPAALVPACPGWDVRELAGHVAHTHGWAARVVESRAPAERPDDDPGDTPLATWYAGHADRLVERLAEADPREPCWNFAGVDETVGFWVRRQLQEALMHLVDLDQARGAPPTTLEPATCADGVAETFEVFLPRMHARGFPADLAAPVGFRATDTGDRWTLVPVPGGPPRLDAAADAEHLVSGTARDLLLRLWNRADGGLGVAGDPAVVGRLLASRLSA